jgi:hypothetical protein
MVIRRYCTEEGCWDNNVKAFWDKTAADCHALDLDKEREGDSFSYFVETYEVE